MKTVVTLIFIALFNGILYGQLKNQDKIIEVYGQERVTQWMNDDPALITLLDTYIS